MGIRAFFLGLLAAGGAAAALSQAPGGPAPVTLMKVEGVIGPATAEFISRGITESQKAGARLLVLQLDTPGGLDTSMRAIIKDILASEVPVATFVAPNGARAASAGTFIVYASHFAAMAPGTNLGAATPVPIMGGAGGSGRDEDKDEPAKGEKGEEDKASKRSKPGLDAMSSKAVNDAAAYIRSLAELRGRNADWGERAVREGASLPASQALEMKVIDVIARDVPELLAALEGREAKLATRSVKLGLAEAPVVTIEPGWRTKFLQVIADPSVALILMMIGIYGLIFEFGSPGFGVPGTIGAICLLLGLFALQLLPISYAGLALIFLGIALMVAEGLMPSFGVLGVGGAISFVIGGIMLLREDNIPGFQVPLGLLAGLAASSALIVVLAIRFALKSRRLPVRSGAASMVGEEGEVLEASGAEGWARVRGERWKVRAPAALAAGDKVRVVALHGLTLDVEPRNEPGKGV